MVSAVVADAVILALFFWWFWNGPAATENGFSWKRVRKCGGLSVTAFLVFFGMLQVAVWTYKFLSPPAHALIRWMDALW